MREEGISYEELVELYSNPTKSLHDLADYFKCGYHSIRRYMIEWEIPIRKHPIKLKLDKKTIEKLYWDEKVSVEEIAKRFNCHLVSIYKFMRKNKIPRRLRRE